VNHIRLIERTISFAPFVHDDIIPFPLDDRIQLEHLWVQIHGAPAHRETAANGLFPTDVRAYIDGIEVTKAIVTELKKAIAAADAKKVRTQYKAGLDAWIKMGNAFGADLYPGNLVTDTALAGQLAATADPATLLTALGDNFSGSDGCLHIFNYLYNWIDLRSISLWDVVETHNASGATPLDVKKAKAPKLYLSNGPCRIFDNTFHPFSPKGQGAVKLRLTLSYHDPQEDKVKELEGKLERLQKQVLDRLDVISDACRDGGPFQLAIATLKGSVAALQQDISVMRGDIASNAAQAAALQAQAKSLQDAVAQL